MKKITFMALLLFVAVPALGAAISVKQYQEWVNGDEEDRAFVELYLAGMSAGFEWVNAHLANDNKKMLFCKPDKLTLSADNYIQLLNDSIEEKKNYLKNKRDFPIAPLLLKALKDTFPCNK